MIRGGEERGLSDKGRNGQTDDLGSERERGGVGGKGRVCVGV